MVETARAQVIDTADWRLIVPLRPALALAGSRLTASMTSSFGGAPAVEIDSVNGSISWTADSSGLTSALIVTVPRIARGSWSAVDTSGRPRAVLLVFDVHRTVTGSTADEWLGRSSVLVIPATDSIAVTAQPRAFQPIFMGGQPTTGELLPALATGPQGPGLALPATYDPIADAAVVFGIQIVAGVPTLVRLGV